MNCVYVMCLYLNVIYFKLVLVWDCIMCYEWVTKASFICIFLFFKYPSGLKVYTLRVICCLSWQIEHNHWIEQFFWVTYLRKQLSIDAAGDSSTGQMADIWTDKLMDGQTE
jgi:hypothetical protein